jgi:GDSL-like Lipase/Acylhydrolase
MKNIMLLSGLLLLGACTYSPPEPAEDPTQPRVPPVAGNADFSKYVALGNSLTAGFMDNALYQEGQQSAYPVILGGQMKKVNGGAPFNFPALGAPGGTGFGGFAPGTSTPVGRLQFILPVCNANPAATRTLGMTPAPLPGESLAPYAGDKAALNNFSAPGTKSFHALVAGYGGSPTLGNPFYWRFASASTASMLADAVAAKGTFFTYWLGGNDILSYAASGGSGDPNPGPNPATYAVNDMTDPRLFTAVLNTALNALLSTGATTKGAVATIPELVRFPFFQLVNAGLTAGGANAVLPFNLSAAQAAALNAGYARFGPFAAGVNFKAGKVNYPVIIAGAGLRHMDPAKDFLTFLTPQDSLLAGPISACNPRSRGGWGITKPIPDNFVLDEAEVKLVSERVAAFNAIIRQQVESRGDRLALVDIHALLGNLDAIRNNIAPGGYFSVDGVHPNPRGQALIANEFIRAINSKFASTLPPVDILLYRQNTLPKP